jgi:D-lactate dehydrogenase (cytochrome)
MPGSPVAADANDRAATLQLEALLGAERVRTDRRTFELCALDFSEERLAVPEVVVEPASTDEVAAVALIPASSGMSLVPHGGGMSYTLAAVPREPRSIVVDLGRMNGLVDLSVANRYVTVETGMTWADLRQRLHGSGMRPPFLGPLSGLHATIGGGLAQGAAGVGRGPLADCVLGLQVVLADGRVLHTGAGAARDTEPFLRNFCPDLTGLFLGDSGSFGVKTRATLRLDPQPAARPTAASRSRIRSRSFGRNASSRDRVWSRNASPGVATTKIWRHRCRALLSRKRGSALARSYVRA